MRTHSPEKCAARMLCHNQSLPKPPLPAGYLSAARPPSALLPGQPVHFTEGVMHSHTAHRAWREPPVQPHSLTDKKTAQGGPGTCLWSKSKLGMRPILTALASTDCRPLYARPWPGCLLNRHTKTLWGGCYHPMLPVGKVNL